MRVLEAGPNGIYVEWLISITSEKCLLIQLPLADNEANTYYEDIIVFVMHPTFVRTLICDRILPVGF